jgi:hypothetical protein
MTKLPLEVKTDSGTVRSILLAWILSVLNEVTSSFPMTTMVSPVGLEWLTEALLDFRVVPKDMKGTVKYRIG